MRFFNKKPITEKEAEKMIPTLDLSATTQDRIEIQVAKDASAEAKRIVEKVNAHLTDLVEENHFHVKIYMAAGGKPKGGDK